jgi:hypothetical protein
LASAYRENTPASGAVAGEEWLKSIESALKECSILVVLCSPTSISRPWINFEAGAAWMRAIPLLPICHDGLTPGDLPMPLSLRQGVALHDAEGLKRVYARVAAVLGCQIPGRDFEQLSQQLTKGRKVDGKAPPALSRDRAIRKKLIESLDQQRFRWRTLDRIAAEAGLPQDVAADFLRSDPAVRFSKGKSGEIIVGLRSRVGDGGNTNKTTG